MGEVKQINIKKNRDKKSLKDIDIYYIWYITKKKIDDCQNIYVVNSLYLFIDHANGYIEEKNGNKYLIFDSVDENKELQKKYNDVWNGIKEVSDSECDYEKDYMKIKFNSDDNLPLNKPLKFRLITITIRSGFEEDGKPYPQLFFTWYFVWIKHIIIIFFGIYKNEWEHLFNLLSKKQRFDTK